MTRQIEKRLRKLEGDLPGGVILVRNVAPHADDIEINAAIDAMIERGEITEADRPRCASWWDVPNRELDELLKEVNGRGRGLPIRR